MSAASATSGRVLALNAGSSSLKLGLYDADAEHCLATLRIERIGEEAPALSVAGRSTEVDAADHAGALELAIDQLVGSGLLKETAELAAVGHRVVHGGERFTAPRVIDGEVIAAIESLCRLAPLHNPPALACLHAARGLAPHAVHVAVFDTAFHHSLPPAASRYALPEQLYRDHGVRRYGFHGISVDYVSRTLADHLQRPLEQLNLLVAHLGNGASLTAVAGGRSVETSMGFTPLEGLVMGSRAGDLDPSLPGFLERQCGLDATAVDHLLNHASGLQGMCGHNDLRAVHAAIAAGDPAARHAFAVYVHRLRKYLGAYSAVLGRVDALVFTAGVGEHDATTRAAVCRELAILGLQLDDEANQRVGGAVTPQPIHHHDSPVAIYVVATDEERQLAREAAALKQQPEGKGASR